MQEMAVDFLNTFSASSRLNSATSVGKVVTVIVMFAAVWMFGVVIIASSYWREVNSKLQNTLELSFLCSNSLEPLFFVVFLSPFLL
jgi:hypothetical protein